jgi:hypothetical protein
MMNEGKHGFDLVGAKADRALTCFTGVVFLKNFLTSQCKCFYKHALYNYRVIVIS